MQRDASRRSRRLLKIREAVAAGLRRRMSAIVRRALGSSPMTVVARSPAVSESEDVSVSGIRVRPDGRGAVSRLNTLPVRHA